MHKRRYQKTIGYGSVPHGQDRATFVWHVDCHESMRAARKGYMLSMDSAFHPGFDFGGANCCHCKQPMPVTRP